MAKAVHTETKSYPLIHKRANKTAVHKDSIEAMTPETDYKVRGTFVNIEAPGVAHPFSGLYYKGMQYFHEVMEDNKTYVIPLSVARWINERFVVQKASFLQDERGNPIKDHNTVARGKFVIEEHLRTA
jgi:hypothetical protein